MTTLIRRRWTKLHVVFAAATLVVAGSCSARDDTANMLAAAAAGSGDARYAAIDHLGQRHEDAASVVPALQKLLGDDDAKVRWRSARSLGDYGEQAQAAAPELRKQLGDADPVVGFHAAIALGKIGDRSDATIDALVAAVTHADGRVARAAIAALRGLQPDPERVVAVLDQVLSSDDQAVAVHALEAVIERGEGAVPVLNAALRRPRTAYLACAAIEAIGPDAAGAVPALVELLGETKHSQLQIQGLLALASIGPEAESAAPQIVPLLAMTTDLTVPVAAAYALGAIGAEEADAELRAAAAKPDPFLQMVAAWSLAKIHPDDADLKQQAIEKLEAGLASDEPAIQAAAEKGLRLLGLPPDATPPE